MLRDTAEIAASSAVSSVVSAIASEALSWARVQYPFVIAMASLFPELNCESDKSGGLYRPHRTRATSIARFVLLEWRLRGKARVAGHRARISFDV